MASTMIRKTVTTATWQRMLAKAMAEGVTVRQLTGSGAWVATSGTDTDAAYEVSLFGCSCKGHDFHGYCKHRAALAFKLGRLTPAPDPTPPAPAVAVAPRRIGFPDCDGRGYVRTQSAIFATSYRVMCQGCRGIGERVPDRIAA